ncbi:MAG: hypothetical protein GWN18_12740, partial [Thermoplasmata archaeon]|nr:hypothetical protein [Thermoplasmata archaeon]NIS12922.1 hypothetical protein [Thermoplasmata archaeon]NIS20830.1 hypothetical protein [Thermoplasmata archaeon]NIT78243.1 hypothetical protein [Thermoplasmata archaeon]NIU49889.1 hypothetical protein [Thermoplasmata archaeon]
MNVGSDGSQLLYSTYFGGDKGEEPRMLHVDEGGDLYIAGYSGSTDLPVSSGAYRATNPGVYSGFVVKFDPSTSTVEFCTYLGGSGADTVNGGFVDDNGTTYIVGYTESSDFPVTSGAFSTTWTADSEAFVAAIGPEGRDLRYSTFITTTDPSMASSVVGSGDGRVCVAGITNATDFPVTPDANKTTPPDLFDVFLAVFDGSLSRLLYCTLVGGTDDDYDPIVDIGPDGETVFLGAYSFSSDLSTSVDAFDPLARGYEDGVLGRFDLTSYRLEYMT